MSIAVAVAKNRKVVIAADSLSTFGDRRVPAENHRCAKVVRVGSGLIASTGWGLYDNILEDYLARPPAPRLQTERQIFRFFVRFWKELHRHYPFVNDKPDKDDRSPFADLDSSFLVATKTAIFYVASDMSVTRFDQYYAVGCAAQYALGALHVLYSSNLDAKGIATKACDAAIAFDIHCGSPVQVFSP